MDAIKPGVMFSDPCFQYSGVALMIMNLSRTGYRDIDEEAAAVD